MDRVNLKLGEKRYVMIEVRSCNNQPFEIVKASYKLSTSTEVEDSGECEINQVDDKTVVLMALIQPRAKGTVYSLEFTYQISPETIMYRVLVGTE